MLALPLKEVQRIAKVSWNAIYDGIIPLESTTLFIFLKH
jgi:hypothetical protein